MNRRYSLQEIERLWCLLCSHPDSQIAALKMGIADFEVIVRTLEKLAWGNDEQKEQAAKVGLDPAGRDRRADNSQERSFAAFS
jgi:hypothetical protein